MKSGGRRAEGGDAIALPAMRSWRDIPQQVRPRAMSKEGRRRLRLRLLRATAGVVVLGLLGWGAWEVASALQDDGKSAPAAASVGPIKAISLATDGVLDRGWLTRTLALPKNPNLMGIDLGNLRARVLASGQARTAAIIRDFPSTLSVRISERSPVARIQAPAGDPDVRALLVARDGVVYKGSGYDPAMIASLPWLDGVKLARQGGRFAPIEGMPAVAELLSSAQLETGPVYRTWQTVSLTRLQSDREIDVRTRDGLTVTFSAQSDYFRQLAKLDMLLDLAKASPDKTLRDINLALGGQVPVSVAAAAGPAAPSTSSGPVPSAASGQANLPYQIHLK